MIMVVYGVLLVVGIVLLVVVTVRVWLGGLSDVREQASGSDGTSARGILEERYAADELSTQEYEHRLRVLEGGHS
ncbi:MAG: SHOCT domain-containing protein [Ornithinimicrobium sp.]